MSDEDRVERLRRAEERKQRAQEIRAVRSLARSQDALRKQLAAERHDRVAEKQGKPTSKDIEKLHAELEKKQADHAFETLVERLKPTIASTVAAMAPKQEIPVARTTTKTEPFKPSTLQTMRPTGLDPSNIVVQFYCWIDGVVGKVDVKCANLPSEYTP